MAERNARARVVIRSLMMVLSVTSAVCGQSQSRGGTVRFEVASIHPHDPASRVQSKTISPDGIAYYRVNLVECIEAAYGVSAIRILGKDALGPVLADDYDVIAKAGRPASPGELMTMFQTLLADRFALRVEVAQKEFAVYFLVAGKKVSNLRASKDAGEGYFGISLDPPQPGVGFHRTSMAKLADFLSGLGPIGRPVIDKTGLDGLFDFQLSLSEIPTEGPIDKRAIFAWPSIFSDVQELGLKLEPGKAQLPVIMIDHAGKPSAN